MFFGLFGLSPWEKLQEFAAEKYGRHSRAKCPMHFLDSKKDRGLTINYGLISDFDDYDDIKRRFPKYSQTQDYKDKTNELTRELVYKLPEVKGLTTVFLYLENQPDQTLRSILFSLPRSIRNVHIHGPKLSNDKAKLTAKAFNDMTLNLSKAMQTDWDGIYINNAAQFESFEQENYHGPKIYIGSKADPR